MTLQEFYARVGGDYSATLSRLPSEALIKKFVLKYPGDPSFEQLRAALDAQDWELAFRASHTLKGVAQNLGMDRLYKAPPPSAMRCAAPSRWRMQASGHPSLPPMRKCWRRSGNCKAPTCRPVLQNTMCGASAAAQETGVLLPCIIKRRAFPPCGARSAACCLPVCCWPHYWALPCPPARRAAMTPPSAPCA